MTVYVLWERESEHSTREQLLVVCRTAEAARLHIQRWLELRAISRWEWADEAQMSARSWTDDGYRDRYYRIEELEVAL